MKNLIKMDDLGVPLFQETSICDLVQRAKPNEIREHLSRNIGDLDLIVSGRYTCWLDISYNKSFWIWIYFGIMRHLQIRDLNL